MKHVFIDIRFSLSLSATYAKFNGGNNYTIRVIRLLDSMRECSTHLLCEVGAVENARNLFPGIDIRGIDSLGELRLNDGDVLFSPHVDDSKSYAHELEELKFNNPKCKICLTVHDRRHLELGSDKYDGLLREGIKVPSAALALKRRVGGVSVDKALKRIIALADKIFTVSNYSMQAILRMNQNIDIKYYTQRIGDDITAKADRADGDILFVSAGRREKNFVRALIAFEKYVEASGSDIRLIATGLSDRQKERIIKSDIVRKETIDNHLEMRGYIDNAELDQLYDSCRFLLYPSRNEGYGLPVAEAMLHGMPSVASRVSSIPEVTGSAAVYVSPTSEDSIYRGISLMMDDDYYEKMLEYVLARRRIMIEQIKLDERIFVNDLLFG
ncbi:MAG: glycosyltransferase [Coriobacteriales bacterium]|nr:glycosyltransferase [Coriobacteriales bacterium]